MFNHMMNISFNTIYINQPIELHATINTNAYATTCTPLYQSNASIQNCQEPAI